MKTLTILRYTDLLKTTTNSLKRFRLRPGFTLIEVLIAIFIFSVIVTVVFASFKEISFSAHIISTSNAVFEMIEGAMGVMKRDLESAYVAPKMAYVQRGFNDDPDPYRFEAKTDMSGSENFPQIRFTTINHLPVNRDTRKGIAEVVYYMDETDEYGWVLRRSDRIYFQEDFEKKKTHPVLMRHVKSMAVKYIDEEGEEHDDWDSDSDETGYATPSAVDIRVEIEDEDRILPFETRIEIRCVRGKSE